jgi:hypothetical protein
MFFQWNRRQGWAATGNITGWNSKPAAGDTWERANDPCPEGWRVPTRAEFLSLLEVANSVWAVRNGINGRLFGTYPDQIFLPAAGLRFTNGALYDTGIWGAYWSSTASPSSLVWILHIHIGSGSDHLTWVNHYYGFSVRCVTEATMPPPPSASASPSPPKVLTISDDIGDVIINDIRWATHNVDTPGTFTRNSEDFGGYFTWEEAQNACPQGWRLPTEGE